VLLQFLTDPDLDDLASLYTSPFDDRRGDGHGNLYYRRSQDRRSVQVFGYHFGGRRPSFPRSLDCYPAEEGLSAEQPHQAVSGCPMIPSHGGMTVVGCVTGTHLIEDLKIAVPFRCSVTISAEDVLRSRDLSIAIQQKKVFTLINHMGGLRVRGNPPPKALPAAPAAVSRGDSAIPELQRALRALEASNKELIASRSREGALQDALAANQELLKGIQGSLQRIEAKEPVVVQGGVVAGTARSSSDVVGGEAPQFIPKKIKPQDVETRITVEKQEGTADLDASRSKLRELRRKQQG